MRTPSAGSGPGPGRPEVLLVLYLLLLCYGSLYPFSGWRLPADYSATVLGLHWPGHVSKSDLVTNLIIYLPLGYLGGMLVPRRVGPGGRLLLVTVCGAAFSLAVETAQIFLPARESSLSDLVWNSLSTLLGAWAAGQGWRGSRAWMHLEAVREQWLPGNRGKRCLALLLLWALAQLAPLVPSLDLGILRHGLSPLWRTFKGTVPFDPWQFSAYALYLAALAAAAIHAARRPLPVALAFALLTGMVLVLKIPVAGRGLSLEALAGWGAALVALLILPWFPRRFLPIVGALLVAAGFAVDELRPALGPGPFQLYPFNWIPFKGQLENLMGLVGILENLFPFAALAVCCSELAPRREALVAWLGASLIIPAVGALEWAQCQIPGRYPDLTAVLLALLGWGLPWCLALQDEPAGGRIASDAAASASVTKSRGDTGPA